MTRLLHTADVHLRADAPERLDALRECLVLAESTAVDVVTIGGDLFDSPEDAEALRPTLRNELFARAVRVDASASALVARYTTDQSDCPSVTCLRASGPVSPGCTVGSFPPEGEANSGYVSI